MVAWRLPVVACALAACAAGRASERSVSPTLPADSADYAVYDAVLDAHVFDEASTSRGYVLTDSTFGAPPGWLGVGNPAQAFRPELAGFVAAAFPDFQFRNQRRVALRASGFRSRAAAGMFPTAAISALGSQNWEAFWEAFHARFPDARGPIALTRPGFTPDGAHALVFVAEYAGGMGGRVGYLLLERRDGRWSVLQARILMEA
jgi:hypothetical protein